MKAVKNVVKSVAHGDIDVLREAAGTKLAHAQTAVRQRIAGAVAGEGAVAEDMVRQHKRLLTLQASYDQIIAALKHQAERARKNGKSLKELEAPLQKLGATPVLFDGFQAHLSEDGSLALAWESLAVHLETALIAPARTEVGALFLEADACYSSYLSTVNELGAKQGKERLQKKALGEDKAEKVHERVAELSARKAQMEVERLPRLEAIGDASVRRDSNRGASFAPPRRSDGAVRPAVGRWPRRASASSSSATARSAPPSLRSRTSRRPRTSRTPPRPRRRA
eukprot:7310350-Prymnesium_polylepis.1